MCDKDTCNDASCCGECEPWNCLEQQVNDILATKEDQLQGYVDEAKDAAAESKASAEASAQSAAESKEFRDEAEVAASTAVAVEGVVLGVANTLQDTADKLEQIADELGIAIAGIAVSSWFYTTVSENQTVIPVPADKNAVDVQSIYIEGVRQSPFRGFEFDKTTMTITLTEPLPLGLEIEIILGTYNSDNPNDFAYTLASNNGASLVGTAREITVQQTIDELNRSFQDGGVLRSLNDTLLDKSTTPYQEYVWSGDSSTLPKVVPAGSTPESTGGIGIGAWISVGDASLRGDLASSVTGKGASLVLIETGDTVQEALNKVSGIVNIQSYYSGAGYYNDAVLAAAAAGTEVFLGGDVTLDPSIILDLSAFPNRRYYGGKFINGQILVRGTLGTSISLTSAITEGQKTFTQDNGFAVGDLLLIQNFPTNTNDAYTSGTPSLFMGGTRTYAVSGSTTLRDTRRKQLFDVAAASSTSFTTYQEAIDDFSTSSLTAAKVNTVDGVSFDCDFSGGTLWCEYTDGLQLTGRFENTFLNNVTCIRSNIRPIEFFSNTDARIDLFEACTGFKINTITSGHTSTGDNSIIKILGCHSFDIDAVITGTNVNTGYAHGVMVDTIFEENPSGYPALPSRDYTVRVNASSIRSTTNGSHVVSIVSDPYRAKNIYGKIEVNSAKGTVHLKGCESVVVEGVSSIISMEGARYCDISNLRRDSDYLVNWTSVYGAVNNLNHIGVHYSDTTGTTVTGETTAGSVTLTSQQVTFIRRGREVSFNLICSYSDLTGTGNLVVNIPTLWSCKSGIIHNFSAQVSGQNNIYAQMVDGTRSIRFQRNDTSYVAATDVTAGTIRIAGTYIVDFITL